MKKIAISIGDINGVGVEIALKAHKEVSKLCNPIYCINKTMLKKASKLLDAQIPNDIQLYEVEGDFEIDVGKTDAQSGRYSYESFLSALKLTCEKKTDALVTMPIHKEAWMLGGIKYKGHTDMLRDYFKKDAIMMLGCSKMFVALYTEHIPLKDVAKTLKEQKLTKFLTDMQKSTNADKVAVLGLNPHAGDNGVLGDEEKIITNAIKNANEILNKKIFHGPLVPDVAFTPHTRANYNYFVAMYHDQGLAPLKALYFDESINVSLNLPVLRSSVDHGTAFDIAYKNKANTTSYINAVKYLL